MAETQPTNTYDSYDLVKSIKEDVASVIYDVSPTRTPVLTMAKKTTAMNTNHEWQLDSLADAAANAHIEGTNTDAVAITAPTRIGNYTQIAKKGVVISGTQEALDFHGIKDVFAREMLRRGEEIKRDIELAITANNAKVAGNSTTARECGGIQAYLISNTDAGGLGQDPANGLGGAARTPGTARALDEATMIDVLQSIYTNGGEPDCMIVGTYNKRVVSTFTGGATKYRQEVDRTVTNAVDIYISDFGEIEIMADIFTDQAAALILQKDMIGVATMKGRNFQKKALASDGDYMKAQLLTEFTLEVRNEAACGIIADLTTSA